MFDTSGTYRVGAQFGLTILINLFLTKPALPRQ